MGGGGSINYTMIHESSSWLAKHLGFSVNYWNSLKKRLNAKFKREPTQWMTKLQSPLTSSMQVNAVISKSHKSAAAPRTSRIKTMLNLDNSTSSRLNLTHSDSVPTVGSPLSTGPTLAFDSKPM